MRWRNWEKVLGKFKKTATRKRPTFQASAKAMSNLDWFVQSGQMRLPSAWPQVKFAFENFQRLSCSELLLLGGPLGRYYLEFCDIDDQIKVNFSELLICLEQIQVNTPLPNFLSACVSSVHRYTSKYRVKQMYVNEKIKQYILRQRSTRTVP